MANSTLRADSAHHNPLTFTLSPGMAPAAPMMRLLARFDRQKVEAFAEVSIALLDLVDGDPDIELNGDELDGHKGEDDFCDHLSRGDDGPGCPIADPDAAVDDSGCDDNELDLDAGYYDHPEFIPGGGSGF